MVGPLMSFKGLRIASRRQSCAAVTLVLRAFLVRPPPVTALTPTSPSVATSFVTAFSHTCSPTLRPTGPTFRRDCFSIYRHRASRLSLRRSVVRAWSRARLVPPLMIAEALAGMTVPALGNEIHKERLL